MFHWINVILKITREKTADRNTTKLSKAASPCVLKNGKSPPETTNHSWREEEWIHLLNGSVLKSGAARNTATLGQRSLLMTEEGFQQTQIEVRLMWTHLVKGQTTDKPGGWVGGRPFTSCENLSCPFSHQNCHLVDASVAQKILHLKWIWQEKVPASILETTH